MRNSNPQLEFLVNPAILGQSGLRRGHEMNAVIERARHRGWLAWNRGSQTDDANDWLCPRWRCQSGSRSTRLNIEGRRYQLTSHEHLAIRPARLLMRPIFLQLFRILVLIRLSHQITSVPRQGHIYIYVAARKMKKTLTMSDGLLTVLHAFPLSTSPALLICPTFSISCDEEA